MFRNSSTPALSARFFPLLLAFLLIPGGCGDDDTIPDDDAALADGQAQPEAGSGSDGGPWPDGGGPSDGGAGDGGAGDGGTPRCPAEEVGAVLGRPYLMVGGSMEDSSFAAAPFDLRYRYVAGNVPEGGPCADCANNCYVDGASCANTEGCAWWGCWQWDQLPPGRFVADLLANTAAAGAVPMITYYIWYSVAGDVEGTPEIAALNNGSLLTSYLADFRFICQVMNEDPSIRAILHIEPDLWGYGHQVNADPGQIPTALSAVGASECSAEPDTLAGLARCMLAIGRNEAPNLLLAFHASAWGEGHDALQNPDPQFDLAGHAQATVDYMLALGAGGGDLVVVEMNHRDAGYNNEWWDETNATLPNFTQAISWVQTLGEQMDLATLWWQVPYGHPALEDQCGRYRDNRVDYFFDHPGEFAVGGALGIAFGAGMTCMTTPETDDGHFLSHAAPYFAGTRPSLCGP